MKPKLFFIFLILTFQVSFSQTVPQSCYQPDTGLYQYYSKLENIANVDPNFNKTDFINYVTTYGNTTAGNLTLLNNDVLSVSKSFPTSQTPILQMVISIDSNSDIRNILSNLNNSVSMIECRNNGILLSTNDLKPDNSKIFVTENPITEKSKLIIRFKN